MIVLYLMGEIPTKKFEKKIIFSVQKLHSVNCVELQTLKVLKRIYKNYCLTIVTITVIVIS